MDMYCMNVSGVWIEIGFSYENKPDIQLYVNFEQIPATKVTTPASQLLYMSFCNLFNFYWFQKHINLPVCLNEHHVNYKMFSMCDVL